MKIALSGETVEVIDWGCHILSQMLMDVSFSKISLLPLKEPECRAVSFTVAYNHSLLMSSLKFWGWAEQLALTIIEWLG